MWMRNVVGTALTDGDGTRRRPVWRTTLRPTWPSAARSPLVGGLEACRRPTCRPHRARGRPIWSWRESAPPKWAAQAADRSPGGAAAPLPPAHHTYAHQHRCGLPNTQGGSGTTTAAGRRHGNAATSRGAPFKRERTARGSAANARQPQQQRLRRRCGGAILCSPFPRATVKEHC